MGLLLAPTHSPPSPFCKLDRSIAPAKPKMGVDLPHKHKKNSTRSEPESDDVYLLLLVKLYRFLVRRTNSAFNENVLRRLYMSKNNRPPMSLSRLSRYMKGKDENQIAVVVGTVLNDERMLKTPKLTVCCLRISESARARIVKAGGKVLTFDQLALQRPTGSNCVLLRGRRTAREVYRHFKNNKYVLALFPFSLTFLTGHTFDQREGSSSVPAAAVQAKQNSDSTRY